MKVHLGLVKEYFPQKGFGFVTNPLDFEKRKGVFFHISNVQKYNKDIADKLSSYKLGDNIYFYYEAENTPKGFQVKRILPTDGIGELIGDDRYKFFASFTILWGNIKKPQSIWLHDVTQDFFGNDILDKFIISRTKKEKDEELEQKRKERLEKKRQKELELQEQQRKIREEERQKQLEIQRQEKEKIEAERQKQRELQEQQRKIEEAEQERQDKIRYEEFQLLVAEIKPKGFTMSWQVSNYIIKNRLGDKYKHISGILVMESEGSTWKFNGGFPPDIYAKLCQEIGLGNKGTNSRVVGFTAFKDL